MAGLRLGGTTFQAMVVYDSGDRHGLLGADVLQRGVWALDGPDDRLWVRDP